MAQPNPPARQSVRPFARGGLTIGWGGVQVRELATAFAKKSGGAKLKKKDFSDVLCESFGIDEALASKHFDAFCVFKNSPTVQQPCVQPLCPCWRCCACVPASRAGPGCSGTERSLCGGMVRSSPTSTARRAWR